MFSAAWIKLLLNLETMGAMNCWHHTAAVAARHAFQILHLFCGVFASIARSRKSYADNLKACGERITTRSLEISTSSLLAASVEEFP
jgi:hypothetical protein